MRCNFQYSRAAAVLPGQYTGWTSAPHILSILLVHTLATLSFAGKKPSGALMCDACRFCPDFMRCCRAGHIHAPLVLQISDIHISAHQHLPHHSKRYVDFLLFSTVAAPRLGPAAVILTGDLTEAKSADILFQKQYDWEWQAYANATTALKQSAGPSCQVLSRPRHTEKQRKTQ